MKRTLLAASFVILATLTAHAAEKVKIGLIAPLTGDVKTYGESSKNGFLIAVEEYNGNAKSRYRIDPVIADDKNDPTEGTNAALKLITQDRVKGIVGPLTSKVALPVSEIVNTNKIPMISGTATNPKVTVFDGKRKSYVFRACYIDPFQGKVGANFALKDLKAKSAAVMYDVGNDYSKGLAEVFKASFSSGKGTITAYESYQKDDVDFSGLITKIALRKPDVIYIPDYYNKVALIAKQIREKGLKSTLLGGDGWDSPELLKGGGAAVVGGYFTNHYSPDRKDPVTESFIKKYKQKHGNVPDALGALTYDAAVMMFKALDETKKPTADELLRQIAATKSHKGATGTISFDKNGDAVKSTVILRLDKDGAKYVSTTAP